ALAAQRHTGDIDAHRAWISLLLTHYYDPMYAHQHDEKAARVVFSGDRQAVLAFLQERVTAAA
ncbi:MAG TPA: tRNA 2-selenouridine(34) synthase MnmH, partial [Burkholderiaceae bacterium]|nr:tRNA 2-selenouridine(34) synthase MnmH [Burkholderiaceae bacterium]